MGATYEKCYPASKPGAEIVIVEKNENKLEE